MRKHEQFVCGAVQTAWRVANPCENYAKTLTESTFNFSISNEEVRGGSGNALWGKYFHDSNLAVTLTDAMFRLEYVAANLGVDINMGGLSVYESPAQGESVGSGGVVTLTNTAVAFNGSVIAWYKKPADANWQIATVTGNKITIPGYQEGDTYCVKYFYQNPDARSITINTQYVPKVLHVVILNDLFSGDPANIGGASKYGRIITDIPSFQLDGNQDLNLTATSAATVSLTGNALGVMSGDSCEEEPYYGTMTEEIFGYSWKEDVIALAIENSDIEIAQGGKEQLAVRAVFGGSVASQRVDAADLTFAVESGGTYASVAPTGVVSGTAAGEAVISVTLKGHAGIVAYATVTVS